MPAPGYYKTNYRALRFSELLRMYGWLRAPWLYLVSRRMRPSSVTWFPGLWSETECRRVDLSDDFWRATESYRKGFGQLGFIEIGFQNHPKNLHRFVRDTGGIRYWNADHTCFGQLIYHRIYHPNKRVEIIEVIIAFTAVFDDGTFFACTNTKKAFDALAENEVVRLNSNDPVFIHKQFQKHLQRQRRKPRAFADVETLRHWYDERQQKAFEIRVNRRLFLPMTEQEIAAARAKFEGKAQPPIPGKNPTKRFKTLLPVWLILIGCIVALALLRHYLGNHAPIVPHSRDDTMEYRGQQFKLNKAYNDFDDYKNDPNNLNTNELDRIERIMTTAEAPPTFKDAKAFFEFVGFQLVFPGYGNTSMGAQTDDGSHLLVEAVEIPQRDKDRVLVARETGGELKLVDDFIYNTATNELNRVRLEKQALRYYDSQNRLLREKSLN
jgi:hypothetical protein